MASSLRVWICLVVTLAFGCEVSAGCDARAARALVADFYRVGHHPGSPADAAAVDAARAQLSASLRAALQAAIEHRNRFIEHHPPERLAGGAPPIIYKPPFSDGDMFTGSPDGAATFEVVTHSRAADGAWRVQVASLPEPNMSAWQVDAVIRAERGRCVIDDVHYTERSSTATLMHYLRYRKD